MKEITTLAIIEKDDQVLLAMKKRGFGEGWWNGYGGKLKPNEDIEAAMLRELEEESGLIAREYKQRGIINFLFSGSGLEVEMHIFSVTQYIGKLVETEEMRPEWFKKDDIPYHSMWPGDDQWMPLYFKGKYVTGEATFDGQTKELLHCNFTAQ